METHQLKNHLLHLSTNGYFQTSLIPVTEVKGDEQEQEAVALPKKGKKPPPKKKATHMIFTMVKGKQLVMMVNQDPVHMVAGDTVILHRTSNLHPVGCVVIRNTIAVGILGRTMNLSCRDVKRFYPM